jgi:transglutaminase-like putative cysteine protease
MKAIPNIKIACLALLLLLVSCAHLPQSPQVTEQKAVPSPVMVKRFPARYHIRQTVSKQTSEPRENKPTDTRTNRPATFTLAIPLPRTTDYHDVANIIMSQGTLLTFPGTKDNYVSVTSDRPVESVTIEYDITLYQLHADFARITSVYPYDTQSALYRNNTANAYRIEADHPQISAIADALWKESAGYLDYARRAFRHEQKILKYKSSGKFFTVKEIFANGGGDCGALSTIYISLLRNKGLPARYMTGIILKDNAQWSYHIWAEFYIEKYGWIPADPSFFSGEENYFGYHNGKRIFFNQGAGFTFMAGFREQKTRSFQTPVQWQNGSSLQSLLYTTDIKVSLLEDSAEEKEFNSTQAVQLSIDTVAGMIDRLRREKNLPLLNISRTLSNVMSRQLDERFGPERPQSAGTLKDLMAEARYRPRWWRAWEWSVGPAVLHREEVIAEKLAEWDALLEAKFREAGIGYRYSKKDRTHYYTILIAEPK